MRERNLSLSSALSSAFALAVFAALGAGSCARGTTNTPPTTCSGGLSVCGSQCADLQSDARHCGSCSNSCGAGQSCNNGSCGGCVAPLTMCGSSCVDVNSDPNH